ncbi:hypothetical protein HDV00_007501 [Rhizophlyctis rosea]|nr:hypothetical protein HDV00_007501 [Rhizophlyctis rosea]
MHAVRATRQGASLVLTVLLLIAGLCVDARPDGAPRCTINGDAIAKGHGTQSADSTGYQLSASPHPSDPSIIIIILGNMAGRTNFGGILLYVSKDQADSATAPHLGQFISIDTNNFHYQTDICKKLKVPGDDWSTVTHSNPTPKDLTKVQFQWKALPGDEVKPGQQAYIHAAVATTPNPWQIVQPLAITVPGGTGNAMTTVTTTTTMTEYATASYNNNMGCTCPPAAPASTRVLKCTAKGNKNMMWAPSAAQATAAWPPAPANPQAGATEAWSAAADSWASEKASWMSSAKSWSMAQPAALQAATTTPCTDTPAPTAATSDSSMYAAEAPMNPPAAWPQQQPAAVAAAPTSTATVAPAADGSAGAGY